MYNTQDIAEHIKLKAKQKNISLKIMLTDCELGVNAISEFAKGKQLSSISLAKIADYLDCSVDYLLGRTDIQEIKNTRLNNQTDKEELTTNKKKYPEDEDEIIRIYRSLSRRAKHEFMTMIYEYESRKELEGDNDLYEIG